MQQKKVKNPFQMQEKTAISFRNDSNFLLQKKIAQQEDIEDFQNDSIHISPTILLNKDKNCEKQALNNLKYISHQEQIYQFQTENQNQTEELKNSFIVDNWKINQNQNPCSNKLKQISMGIEINTYENLDYKNNFTNNFVTQQNTIPKQTSENIKNVLLNPLKSDNFRRSTILRYKSTQNFKEIQNKENKENSNLEQEKQRQQFSQIMQKLKILHRMLEKTDEYIPPPQDAIIFNQNRENYIKQILQKPKNQIDNYLNPNFNEFSQINQQENTKPTQSISSLYQSLNDNEKQKEPLKQFGIYLVAQKLIKM
ncbi:hypothetical protein PPERSA_00633 [Pseudocohnilembus persalinus]|uniref:Uncharacterized protein n=1 Tax=Pseudocohnilembus persalinus TaxID=266149 RepID=A0A0V0QSW4_PSEPJ|nr:hypothetical protein PPERSA_00633 [Pseudocohnilembus persalinus]|eukprot:KRX05332.1 hypothetical protein PPERSA_00633 [Pseudocohnilembus persalinus]